MKTKYNSPIFLFVIFTLLFLASGFSPSFESNFKENELSPPDTYSTPWVDSVFSSLTLEQRIAQLMMIQVQTTSNRSYNNRMDRLIKQYNVGGVIFFRGGPQLQAHLTNRWQRQAQTPMLISMDAEWGLAMRLDSTVAFPRQMTLGAITNERLIYELGLEIGWQSKRMGIHINFAPVIDVNSNPRNPVINSRAFGEDRYNVARKGLAYMYGMQDAGIIANAKHFPGHGDTSQDSHHTLPTINHSMELIDSVHLFPFKQLIKHGLHSAMIAHLHIPAIDDRPNMPSSLSDKTIKGLLQDELGFNGLIITDALNMRGVTDFHKPGDLEVKAFLAGNDILLSPDDLPTSVKAIKSAIDEGEISEDELNERVRKVLYFKELAGLSNLRSVNANNLYEDLNSDRIQKLKRRLIEHSITVIRNENDLLPIQRLDTLKIAAVSIGAGKGNPFQSMMSNYAVISKFGIGKNAGENEINNLLEGLQDYNLVIISVHNNSMSPARNYGMDVSTRSIIKRIAENHTAVLNVFANPYSLEAFGADALNLSSVMVSYQDGEMYEEASAQIIFGALAARGRLPVSVAPYFPVSTGIRTSGGLRVGHKTSDETNMNPALLNRIDSIALLGIEKKAYPGCQIVVLKDGKLVYQKSFGYHTYENTQAVKSSDIYDLASLTKVLGSTAAIMALTDKGLIDLDGSLGDYIPFLQDSNKENLVLREVLAHHAGLRSWIPFFIHSLADGIPDTLVYRNYPSIGYPIMVANNLFINHSYRDSIVKGLIESPLLNRKRYVYSDLGFMLLALLVEEVSGDTFDTFLHDTFYSRMGLQKMGFNPLYRFPHQQIIPTEKDTLFRNQLIHGFVHDPNAAMLGGVSGHAGLFSNAMDVAVMMQMFLEEGSYGGVQFISPETVREFTRVQYAGRQNRRGLGFDKPSIRGRNEGPAPSSASALSFGHTGFTGTYAWADPQEDLVFVFLSNRVYPEASNRKLMSLNIRTEMLQAIYDAIHSQQFISSKRVP